MIEHDAELLEERLAVLGIGDELKLVRNGVKLGGEVTEFSWGVIHRMCRKRGMVIFSHSAVVWT